MTKPDFAAIASRVKAATGGPWLWQDWNLTGVLDDEVGPYPNALTAPPHRDKANATLRERICSDEFLEMSKEDQDFIAHARTDIPDLLAYIIVLKARLGRAETVVRRNNAEDPS